jgi:hypothetical protein
MTQTAHTPGPWFIVFPFDEFDNPPNLLDKDGKHVPISDKKDPVAIANRKLIATAPDLLAAITNLMNGIDTKMVRLETDAHETLANALREIRQAVAKANGDAV